LRPAAVQSGDVVEERRSKLGIEVIAIGQIVHISL
jgi:hypothetical protein